MNKVPRVAPGERARPLRGSLLVGALLAFLLLGLVGAVLAFRWARTQRVLHAPTAAVAAATGMPRVEAPALSAAQAIGPEPFSIGDLHSGEAEGSRWLLGRIRNDGVEARELIRLRVSFDGDAASTQATIYRSYVKPGESAPFALRLGLGPDAAHYRFEAESTRAELYPDYSIRDLAPASEPSVQQRGGELVVAGQLRNTGARPLGAISVTAIFYDHGGAVVALATGEAQLAGDGLAPGAVAAFVVRSTVVLGQPARYQIEAEGTRSG